MEYIGSLAFDTKLKDAAVNIVIFGAGKKLKSLLNEVQILGIRNIACICDNDIGGKKESVEGIPIYSFNETLEKFHDADFVVYNRYAMDICQQLMDNGISKIHLIRG